MKDFSKTHLIFIVLFLIVGLGGGYFWYWSIDNLAAQESSRSSLQGKILKVEKQGLPPTPAVLAKLEENKKALDELSEKSLGELKESASLFDSVVVKQEPGKLPQGLPSDSWKKMMNEKRAHLDEVAKAGKIVVPKDPYYGFKRYKVANPEDKYTGQLGIQLLGINEITSILLDAKIRELHSIKRVFIEDAKNGNQNSSGPGNDEALSASILQGPENLYTIYPFEVVMRCSTSDLRSIINHLNQSKYFFVIRFLMVESEKANVQSRSTIQAAMTGEAVKGQMMVPVAGNEYLQVRLRIDMLVWSPVVLGKQSAPEGKGGAK